MTAVQMITGRASKLAAGLTVAAACVLAGFGIAAAYWIITDSSNFAAATGDSLAAGATPSVSVTPSNGNTVTIAFAKVAMSDGSRVSSYTVRRYPAAGGAATVASVSCSDAATTRTCTEAGVPDGTWKYTDAPALGLHWSGAESALSGVIAVDTTAPHVTVNQASGQADPTSGSPIHFTAVFTEPVTGFTNGDVTLSGTAGATTVVVTEIGPNNDTTYDVAVSGMTSDGTVIANIGANAATDAAGNGNTASSSTDNTVAFIADGIPPDTTIDSTPSNPSNDTSPSFSFSGTDNQTPAASLTF